MKYLMSEQSDMDLVTIVSIPVPVVLPPTLTGLTGTGAMLLVMIEVATGR